jgi:hypothetical protein
MAESRKEARAARRRRRVEEATTPGEQMVAAWDMLRTSLARRDKTDRAGADKVRSAIALELMRAAERTEKGWTP